VGAPDGEAFAAGGASVNFELPATCPNEPPAAVASCAGSSPTEGSLGRRFAPAGSSCEFCGHESLDRHCKVVCARCGAVRDCSDP
jgi:hypothetical protein